MRTIYGAHRPIMREEQVNVVDAVVQKRVCVQAGTHTQQLKDIVGETNVEST